MDTKETFSEKILRFFSGLTQSFNSVKNNRVASLFLLLIIVGFILLTGLILIFAF